MVGMKNDLTHAYVASIIRYNPEDGTFVSLATRGGHVWPGKTLEPALTDTGYRRLKISHRSYLCSRLAHLLMTGRWPEQFMDHIDGNRSNDRWGNLRAVTPAMNAHNLHAARSYNATKLMGVTRRGNGAGEWFDARICVDYKLQHIGCFKTADEAHAAYLSAKRHLHAGYVA